MLLKLVYTLMQGVFVHLNCIYCYVHCQRSYSPYLGRYRPRIFTTFLLLLATDNGMFVTALPILALMLSTGILISFEILSLVS